MLAAAMNWVRDPDTITVAGVLKTVGEQVIFLECAALEDCKLARQRGYICIFPHFWHNFNFVINKIVEETTVDSLVWNHGEKIKMWTEEMQ